MFQFKVASMFLINKLVGSLKANITQNDCWETDPAVEKISTSDIMILELMSHQSVFKGGFEGMLVYFASYCFRNICVKNQTVSSFAFKILNKIILLKNSISRDCFRSLQLYRHIETNIFSALESLEIDEDNLDKREQLFQQIGTCFLSDHLDDYLRNSHFVIEKIM